MPSAGHYHSEENTPEVNEFLTAVSRQRCSYISSDDSSRHMIVCLIAVFYFCLQMTALCLHVEQSQLSVTIEGAVLKMCEKEVLAAVW